MLRLFYASIRKKDGEMMKKSSVNLLKYGLAKHLKETAQIDINIDPVFAVVLQTANSVKHCFKVADKQR
jgi:hypothetical protein